MTPELFVLDVGHGNCAILTLNREAIVIDAARTDALIEFVSQNEIQRVSTIAVSHADSDHMRGVLGLIASGVCQVDSVLVNPDASKTSEQWQGLVYELDERSRRGELRFDLSLLEGDEIEFSDPSVMVSVLAPRRRLAGLGPGSIDRDGAPIASNAASAVIRVSYKDAGVVLLPGDLDEIGLRHLLDTGQDLSARVLVFPHHGGHTSKPGSATKNAAFARALVSVVKPSLIIFSIGRGQNATPREEIVTAVQAAAPLARIACTQLSEHCAALLPTEEPTHLARQFAAGRATLKCCAGTTRVPLDGTEVHPLGDAHQRFKEVAAPTRLCGRAE
jgi:beta-lactamase superfamily II metal-dependent hydrolase